MAVLTEFPTSASPTVATHTERSLRLVRAWCTFIFFAAFAGLGIANAIGAVAAGILTLVTGAVTVVLWIMFRPPVLWRRLPWLPLAYIAWAGASIIWSNWISTSVLTWLLVVITSVQALFVGAMLTWREIVTALSTALKWCLTVSFLFELAVSLIVRGPILPGFMLPVHGQHYDAIVYWSSNNLLRGGPIGLIDGGRIQGIYGNANPLATMCLVALIVFAIQLAAGVVQRRRLLIAWMALAVYLLLRADSATVYLAMVCIAGVLGAAMLMRRATAAHHRRPLYLAFAFVGVVGGVTAFLLRDTIFALLGRTPDLSGREIIWKAVLYRADQHPVLGWGFATPWLQIDPQLTRWVVDHSEAMMQAHNMWLDALMQVGIIGVVLLAAHYLLAIWRTWFFAVDPPRGALKSDTASPALMLLPLLIFALVLVQGITESEPLLMWGWMLPLMFVFKIKQPIPPAVAADAPAMTGPIHLTTDR